MTGRPITFVNGVNNVRFDDDDDNETVPDNAVIYSDGKKMGILSEIRTRNRGKSGAIFELQYTSNDLKDTKNKFTAVIPEAGGGQDANRAEENHTKRRQYEIVENPFVVVKRLFSCHIRKKINIRFEREFSWLYDASYRSLKNDGYFSSPNPFSHSSCHFV
jgi:hypothetical protein